MLLCDSFRPLFELLSRPLEAVVLMTQFSPWQSLETSVVFDVGRSQHHSCGLRKLEQHSFERVQPRLFQMLDNFNHCRGIVTGKPLVSVHQRALDELYSFSLTRRHSIQPQSILRDLKSTMRHIESDDLVDASVF